MASRKDITELLADISAGKEGASEALLPVVYEELRALAKRYMRSERSDHTLQPTALVHEAYIRLGGDQEAVWEDRAHFIRVAARAMRRVLINYAHSRNAQKREGGWSKKPLDHVTVFMEGIPAEVGDLGEALDRLSEYDPQMVRIIELRFFGGFNMTDTARLLGISRSVLYHEWDLAKAWLSRELRRGE